MNLKIASLAFGANILISSCGAFSKTECSPILESEWNSDQRTAAEFIHGYGSKHETYIYANAKSDQFNQFTCEMERIYCPSPHETKGCQRYECTAEEVAGALLQVKDYNGERFYKVPKAGRVRWNGVTYTCPS